MGPDHERTTTLAAIDAAVTKLITAMNPVLVPGEGVALGFALKGARDAGGVASLPGGIRQAGRDLTAGGPCRFGNDDPATRAVLTVMKFDPLMRCAAVLRYSDRALSVLEDDLFLECASFSPAPAGDGTSTMNWGIAFCCREGVPDVVFEKKPDREKSRIVLLGEDPDDVANNIIICSGRI